jgi:hypothetical protein
MTADRLKAQDGVFNTHELLESTPLSLSAVEILFAAQVNQH